jgi:hypothetical protein
MIMTGLSFDQNGKAEQEIPDIRKSLNQAFLNKDISVFERIFADDYVMSGISGKMMNRAEADIKTK